MFNLFSRFPSSHRTIWRGPEKIENKLKKVSCEDLRPRCVGRTPVEILSAGNVSFVGAFHGFATRDNRFSTPPTGTPSGGSRLGQRLRRWPNLKPPLGQPPVTAGWVEPSLIRGSRDKSRWRRTGRRTFALSSTVSGRCHAELDDYVRLCHK